MHKLFNISRSKTNQTFNQSKLFSQLTEYNMRNTFLEKSYTKCGGETILRPITKKSKWGIFLDQ